jgi:ribose-phosphate pyrophosphokinase
MPVAEDLKVFTGNSHPQLARDICSYLGIQPGMIDVFKFKNDNTFVKILENVRERDVFIVQPFSEPVNDHIMELLIMLDAFKRASAGRITAVLPYYAYGRSDKKDQPRVPITARLIASMIEVAGADRVLTLDLHAGQIQGFFGIPVDELTAIPMLARQFGNGSEVVVAATDVGGAKRAQETADILGADIAIVQKRRLGNTDQVVADQVIGEVAGKKAVIVDDEITTGGTVGAAANALVAHGANEVYCAVTHGVLCDQAPQLVQRSPILEMAVTDSLPIGPEKLGDKTRVISIASILGEAIHRIHSGLSVGAMFEGAVPVVSL